MAVGLQAFSLARAIVAEDRSPYMDQQRLQLGRRRMQQLRHVPTKFGDKLPLALSWAQQPRRVARAVKGRDPTS